MAFWFLFQELVFFWPFGKEFKRWEVVWFFVEGFNWFSIRQADPAGIRQECCSCLFLEWIIPQVDCIFSKNHPTFHQNFKFLTLWWQIWVYCFLWYTWVAPHHSTYYKGTPMNFLAKSNIPQYWNSIALSNIFLWLLDPLPQNNLSEEWFVIPDIFDREQIWIVQGKFFHFCFLSQRHFLQFSAALYKFHSPRFCKDNNKFPIFEVHKWVYHLHKWLNFD